MTVTQTTSGNWSLFEGTNAEVVAALIAYQRGQVIAFGFNPTTTKYFALTVRA